MRWFQDEEFSAAHQPMFCSPCWPDARTTFISRENFRSVFGFSVQEILIRLNRFQFVSSNSSFRKRGCEKPAFDCCATFPMNVFHLTLSSGCFLSYAEKTKIFVTPNKQMFNHCNWITAKLFLFQLFVFASAFSSHSFLFVLILHFLPVHHFIAPFCCSGWSQSRKPGQ